MRKTLLFAGLIALAVSACEGGGKIDNPDATGPDFGDATAYAVETQVSTDTVEAGGSVTVTCTVTGPGGAVQVATQVTVTPSDGAVVDGTQVSFTKAGAFQVACEAPGIPAVDDTPATVNVEAGRPDTIDTSVAPATIAAGDQATATCTAKDAQGNPAQGSIELKVTPSEGVTVTTGTSAGTFVLEGRTAGEYKVACALVGGISDASPATLTVTAGILAKVVTVLDGDTMTAGDTMGGHCTAQDAFGNEVAGVAFTVEAPAELTVVNSTLGFTLEGTKAGTYDVTCKPADGAPIPLEKDTLSIVAGPSVGIALKLVPAKPAYQVGNQVKVGFDLVDAYGNPIPGGAITDPTVTPTEGITQISADQFQFDQEGEYVFHACDATNAAICDDVTGWCDGSAPMLTITYPERGATLDGERRVVVTGTVSEATSQVASLTINGQVVSVNVDGSFAFPMVPDQGLNLIDAMVADTFGNEFRTLRSYLYSNYWNPMDQPDPLASLVPKAVKAYLDDTLFWQEDPTDQATISAILETAVAGLDLKALMPNPVTSVSQEILWTTCSYDVYIDSITFGPPDVKIDTVMGGLTINIVIPDLKVDLQLIRTDGDWRCPADQKGTATATKVVLDTTVQMNVHPDTHQVLMTASEATLNLEGFDIEIDNWFYNLLVGLLKGTLENLLKDQVQELLVDQINALPEKINELLAKPFEVTVPELIPGMNAVTLRISLQPQSINFDTNGGAVDLNAAVTSDHTIDRVILGSISRASCLADTPEAFGFDMGNPEKVMLALFDDALNEALYSLWSGRLLNMHLTGADLAELVDLSQYGVEISDLNTAALIPPIVTSCNPNGTLTIQLGDLYLDTTMVLMGEPVIMRVFLFLEVEAQLSLADDPEKGRVIAIQVVNPPRLTDMDFEYLESNLTEQDLRDLFLGALFPVVFQQLEDPFLVEIPSFNLKGLLGEDSPVALPDKDLVIVPETLGNDKGYIHFAAGLELHDPVVEPPAE